MNPAVVMGVILGQIGENVFAQAMVMMDYDFLNFFFEPIAGTLIVMALGTMIYNIFKHGRFYLATFGRADEKTAHIPGD